jgi:iron-sulfur cluster repair protein YtfE (RIC family)
MVYEPSINKFFMSEEKQSSILALMINHHALLETIFFVAKDDIKANSERSKESISSFHREYEKHMFAEENIIFNFLRWTHPKVYQMTIHLTDEHSAIRQLLRKIESELPHYSENNLTTLQSLLSGHRKDEEEHLYPVVVLESQKQRIINRINEIAPHVS